MSQANMELRWKENSTQETQKSSQNKIGTKSRANAQGKQSFKFVQGKSAQKPKRSRLPKAQASVGQFSKFRLSANDQVPQSATSPCERNSSPSYKDGQATPRPLSSTSTELVPSCGGQSPGSDTQITRVSLPRLHPYIQHQSSGTPQGHTTPLGPYSTSLSRGVMYHSLAHKYSAMFSLFNEEFCVVPLSKDCLHNPFRARESFFESYTFLSHAVMAITSHHLAKQKNSAILRRETQNHWSTALQLLSTALAHAGVMPLLDTILLLISFESAQSVFGMLEVHLGGAKRLLSQPAALQQLAQSSRMRAQVAMLVWWDVTGALICQRSPRLADPYLNLLLGFDEGFGWSFLTLVGCPAQFVVAMARLATLSDQYNYDREEEVQDILERVRQFGNPLFTSAEVDSGFNNGDPTEVLDRQYCIESWRHAILLYALRVFNIKQDDASLMSIQYHARMILDSARCIPPTEPYQKQVLLPVFLAGAEVGDDFSRSFVREYCKHWSRFCRFDQFTEALALLEDIWEGWYEDGRKGYWWGLKVERGGSPEDGELQRELLLG